MSQNLSFDVKIPEGHSVQFNQEATFENFIGQFQPFCPKLLCVVDGTILRYYDRIGTLPTNIRFDYKQRRGILTEYYFRSIEDDTLYCVFGREAATIFYPRIDEIDPAGAHELSHKIASIQISIPAISQRNNSSRQNPPIDSRSDICKPKPPPIIQSIRPQIPLFHEISHPKEHAVLPGCKPKEPDRGTITTRVESNRSSIPDHIVIIDQGIKLTFPNPNYPIEIKTYCPS